MSAQHTYGWADLDKMNGSHYGRGKPAELLDAEAEMELAWGRYDRMVDAIYERDEGSREELAELRKAAEQAQDKYTDTYNRVYGNVAQEHLETQYDDKSELDF